MTTPKNIQLWVDALRSGNYEQGQQVLQASGRYCCLGVACKVAQDNGVDVCTSDEGRLLGNTLASQRPTQHWLGLRNNLGELPGNASFEPDNENLTSLITLNDDRALSFEEIADRIETHWQDLVVTEENNNDNT